MSEFKFKFIEWAGEKITKPGAYSKVPLETYHKQICDGPSVSSSGLRTAFLKSPAHFYAEWAGNPGREKRDEKPPFVMGRAVHHLLLGEPFFAKLFAVQPKTWTDPVTGEDCEWRKGKGGAKHADAWAVEQAKAGRAVLKEEDLVNIRGMATRLGMNPIVRAGALNGYIERSFFWKDKETGLWLKIRPDVVPGDSGDYVDYKTTTSVLWRDLQSAIFDYGYFMQLALVREGVRELGLPFTSATLFFQEKANPWCERVVTIKDHELDRGEKANRASIRAIADCLAKGRWPGPGGDREDAAQIELPEWAEKQVDDRIKFGVPT